MIEFSGKVLYRPAGPGSFLRHQGSGFFRSVICKLTLLNLLVSEGNVDGDDDRYSRPDNADYQLPE